MLVTDDDDLADRARHLATQAREPVLHYEHQDVGYNYRLSNLLAAVGRGQLRTLAQRVDRRRRIFELYSEALADVPGITPMPLSGEGRSSCWLSCLLVDADRFGAGPREVITHLADLDVEARPLWKPLHLQPAFEGSRTVGGAVSEDLFARGLCLPSGSDLTDEEVLWVAEEIRSVGRLRTRPAAFLPSGPRTGSAAPASDASTPAVGVAP
jgi:pyridoxal phosphate-dependent aminotransferase EpsN